MDDIPGEDTETGAGNSQMKWVAIGLGVVGVATAGYLLAPGSTDEQWGSAEAETEQPTETIAPSPALEDTAEETWEARGVVQATNEATIASRITARITNMPYRVGSRFRRGAVLARFDCSQTTAQLRAAEAASAAYSKTYETNVELDEYEAIGTNEVAVSKANLNKAQAEAAAIRASLNDCSVRAPFSGTIVEEIAHQGEVAASGQPMLKIQSGGALEAELIVPSSWLTWMEPGARFSFLIDETNEEVIGTVKRLGASVDPVSKTIRVTGDITSGNGLVLPGMSGTASFEKPASTSEEEETASDDEAAGPSDGG